jgi:biotin operon repressor
VRFPNQRLAQLFDLLQNETLPQDELAQRLSVSTRTVRADITALNALLASHGAQFILSRGNGYQLKIDDAERYQQLQQSHPRALRIPRTGPERVHYLVVRFLTSAFSLKLEDLADEWFVSRATLQSDMVEVREWFNRYNLTLETRPRHGMKLFGSEMSIRACLTDLLWELAQQDGLNPLITEVALNAGVPEQLVAVLHDTLTRHHIRLTDEGELFVRLYCAVAVRRISEGYPLPEFNAEDVEENVRDAAKDIAAAIARLADKALSPSEENWLCVHLAARQIQDIAPSAINADDDEALVNYWDHTTLTHCQYEVRRFTAFELFAVYRAGEVNGYAVFCISSAVFVFPGRLLLTQSVQHAVNVGIGHFNNRFFNFDGVQTFQLNFWVHFELYSVGEVFAQFVFAWNIVRRASWIDFFFDDGVNKVTAHQFAQHVLANGSAITLSNNSHWDFALTEAVNTDFFRDVDQLALNSVFDAVSSDSNRYTAAKALSGFN